MGLFSYEWIVNKMITIAGKGALNEIKKASHNPEFHQKQFLKTLIEENKNTVFGKDHNFSEIHDYESYRKNVPIRVYEDLGKYMDLLLEGKDDVLFQGRPSLYNTSSGTTGAPKLIPISEKFKNYMSKFNKLWLYSILEQNPGIFSGKSISSVGKAIESYAKDGLPIGSISGNSYKSIPGIVKKGYSAIYPLFAIDDYDKRYYAVSRNGLEHDITISICPSIANLLRYHQVIMENFDEMVEEIRTGTVRKDIIEAIAEEDREEVMGRIKPNPKRADELIALKEKYGDQLLPKHYWPNIKVINAWIQGNFAILVDRVKAHFPDSTVIRAFGYQASEGRFGISLDNKWNYSLLVPTHYFYEFVEVDDMGTENAPVKMYHEIELGKRYYIIITNMSGLYRYDMNDIVEVVGHYNKTPLVKFIQKGAGVVNILGEKLSEEQIIQTTKKTAEKLGVDVKNYVMYGNMEEFKYEFYVEFGKPLSVAEKDTFVETYDSVLKEMNIEYEGKRGTNRLHKPELFELPEDSHQLMKLKLVERGLAKDGQYKDLYLTTKKTTKEVLDILKLN